jgi:predicted phosphodiesterase
MLARTQIIDVSPYRRIIAVSDLHGADTLFRALLDAVCFSEEDALILVGDYIERGRESLPLLRTLMKLTAQGNAFALMGNCDSLIEDLFYMRFRRDMLQYLSRHTATILHEMLLEQGRPFSPETTEEELREMVEKKYSAQREWLKNLPHILSAGEYVFVHAGLDPVPLDQQDDDKCLKRQDFFETAPAFPFPLIVGHMPCQRICAEGGWGPVFDPARNLVFIDGGVSVLSPCAMNALILEKGTARVVSLPG